MTVGSKVKQTCSTLRGVKETLKTYAIQTQDEELASAYKQAENIISEVVNDLENRIQRLEFEEPQYKGF